jgi:hypothetical protein
VSGPVGAPRRLRAGEHRRGVQQLVEAVDPCDAELAEGGGGHRVGAGEVAGVRLRHGASLVGAAHLDAHDRDAVARRLIGGQQQGAPVLEPLDVARDGSDLGPGGEVPGEVGELEVGLVAGRRPVRKADAELLTLEDGPALMAALGDQRDRPTGQVGAELLEGVEVRVGTEQMQLAPGDELLHLPLELLALGADLGEAGGEHHRESGLLLDRLLERRQRVADEDHGEVDVGRHVEHRTVARDAVDLVAVGVDREHAGARGPGPCRDLLVHRGVGLPRGVGGADHRHGAGAEEHVEVERAGRHGPPGHVARGLRHACQVIRPGTFRSWRRPNWPWRRATTSPT